MSKNLIKLCIAQALSSFKLSLKIQLQLIDFLGDVPKLIALFEILYAICGRITL